MKFQRNTLNKSCIIFAVCLIISVLSAYRLFNNYELLFLDLRFKLRPPQKVSSDIMVVEISDDTLKNLGKWPLPRDFHASLVDVLKEFGARMIVFDILFSEPTVYDDTFSKSIERAGNVYLPLAFYIDPKDSPRYLVTESKNTLADISESLKQNAAGIGHLNVFIDPDGKTRRIPLFIKYNNSFFAQLGLMAATDWLGLNIKNLKITKNKVVIDHKLFLPILEDGSFMVNYPDRWERSFTHLSYFEILKSYAQIKQGKTPDLDLSVLRDKVCFIGLTATGTSDLKAVPVENIYPMLGLQASVFNSILNKDFISDAGLFFNTLINLLIFISSLIVCLRFSPLKAFLGNMIVSVGYLIFSVCLFIFFGIWVDLFFPLLIIVITYMGSTLYRFFNEAKKRQLLENELEIARTIQKSFLPADIREFKDLTISSFLSAAKFVAGDLYDIQIIDAERIGIFIADVSGKGVAASLIMAQIISLFRIFARQYLNTHELLRRLNKELYAKFEARFVTALYMIMDTKKEIVSVCSAGHAPLLFYKCDIHRVEEIELLQDLPLCLMDDIEYKEINFKIQNGDKIIIFTDGLMEARNQKNHEFGLHNIKRIILDNADSSAQGLSDVIKKELFEFSFGMPLHDDITLIVLEKK